MTDDAPEYQCSDCGMVVPADAKVCPKCGTKFEEPGGSKIHSSLPKPLSPDWARYVEQKLRDLESKIPNSEIISHSFWRRAWTVFGYSAAIEMVIALGLFLLALLVRACVG